MFTKAERSGFKYWFAHWCAFNMTALNLKCWKPRFLLHDIEKPWLKLILRDYKKVQKWHRYHNAHHLEYLVKNVITKNKIKADWLGMVIDWECSHFTKIDSPLLAHEVMYYEMKKMDEKYPDLKFNEQTLSQILYENMTKVFDKLKMKY